MNTFKDFETYLRVTLKLDDNWCRIHSVSYGDKEIVTNERYVVMRGRWLPDMAKTRPSERRLKR